jgi:peptidoglycan/LPS O-acetylase OafA/YrhL
MRIKELDGLRGISILVVALFHYFSRWTDLYPYQNTFAEFPLFKFGSFGVQLFFMISGLVIFMSLDKTKSFFEFMFKRWIRLIPSMFMATLFILLTAKLFPHRPIGAPRLIDSLPGITLIDPYWLTKLTHISFASLEGAFWSLYVEFRYYFIFGLIYFVIGRNIAVWFLALITLISGLVQIIIFMQVAIPGIKIIEFIFSDVLLGRYLFWFLIGMFGYEFRLGKLKDFKILFILTIIASIVFGLITQAASVILVEAICLIIFWGLLEIEFIKKLLRLKVFMFLGLISYPLYLIHENAGVSLIIDLAKIGPIPGFILPILALIILSAICYPQVKYLEPIMQKWLKKLYKS